MRVQLLHVAGCPNVALARKRVLEAAGRAGIAVTVDETLMTGAEGAGAPQFLGSPTILVDGVDPFAPPGAVASLACRLYRSDDGLQGAPPVAAIVESLRAGSRPAGSRRPPTA